MCTCATCDQRIKFLKRKLNNINNIIKIYFYQKRCFQNFCNLTVLNNFQCSTVTSRRKFLGGHRGCQAKFWWGCGPPGTPLAPPMYIYIYVKILSVDFISRYIYVKILSVGNWESTCSFATRGAVNGLCKQARSQGWKFEEASECFGGTEVFTLELNSKHSISFQVTN